MGDQWGEIEAPCSTPSRNIWYMMMEGLLSLKPQPLHLGAHVEIP